MTTARRASSVITKAVNTATRDKTKPLAIVLAGHNGSGKSTLWSRHLAPKLKMPLINADRMMLAVLPEVDAGGALPSWAQDLRDNNELWMGISQKGVQAFVAQAMGSKAPFAFETVFSYWEQQPDGTIKSKIGLIQELQAAGYFVLLLFVGLSNFSLSVGRVQTRKSEGGHDVAYKKLKERFPRTQQAINAALNVADAAILFDNSRSFNLAFTPVQVRNKKNVIFDIREAKRAPQNVNLIREWLDIVAPAQ